MSNGDHLRPALYHRFHRVLPLLAHPASRRLWRVLVRAFWLLYFAFVFLVLVLRYSILPNIEDYRPAIERLASRELGQAVSIGRIEASWAGLNPDLTLLDVRVSDAEARPVLGFSKIEAVLSWWSVSTSSLKLRLLRIDEPILHLRRDAAGLLHIAGIPLRQEQGDTDVSEWVLAQRRIRIRGATLVWEDELRKAPPLILEDLNLALDNDGKQHRFGLTALPPENLASRIDVRGDFRGRDIERMQSWSGKAYAEIDYIDLAIWRQWIDYPVALPHGRGALRAWAGFAEGRLQDLTADASLQDVSIRLASDLPSLALEQMSGRIGAKFTDQGFEVSGRRIELAGRDVATKKNDAVAAIHISPTDFNVEWQPGGEGQSVRGNASFNQVDIGALASLAAYLPFDAQSRKLLNEYAPQGRVSKLSAKWKGDAEQLKTYSLRADFEALALKAQGYFPGFSGLSGSLEASEKGGKATLDSQKSSIDVPSVFPVSLIELDRLSAQAKWKLNKGELHAELTQMTFASPDAAGSVQGSYQTSAQGPGIIDLTASLSRADARAVWRYMPHVVGEGARHWLRDALLSGGASEATLALKGNLLDFPFLDKSKGQFLVTVKAHDVALDYGTGWPRIDGISGDLRFEGNGMIVDARRGSILGAQLSNTRAEIPDFDKPISTLHVNGKAEGPTSEFLKFIDQSPVAGRIDNFTEDMRATGNGHLDIALVIPLDEAKLGDSTIEGTYHFTNNEVLIDAALPPVRQVNGSVQFSGSALRVPEITGSLFGGPLKIKGGSQKDGRVLITANGAINIAQLRKQMDSPLLEVFSGNTPYRGEVRINKRNADLVIDSTLVGLASALPEPFAKRSEDSLALRIERKTLPSATAVKQGKAENVLREQLSASLGADVSMQVIRRKKDNGFVVERGAIAIGRALQLPESGLLLGLSAKRLDLDAWRNVPALQSPSAVAARDAGSATPMLNAVNIKAAELILLGRHINDVDLTASALPGQWSFALNSRQAIGNLEWNASGRGKLSARFKKVALDAPSADEGASMGQTISELPALDIVADEFSLGERRFGRFELQARNDEGVWHLGKINATNPFGSISGNGQWDSSAGKHRTRLDFKIESSDVGKMLERFGYPGTVRAGTAKLEGRIGWQDGPVRLDYKTLSGEMRLEASKGQFVKLDPGAAGKLLGLISLQGLARRITLDFKDVFSDGLAFDSISSKVVLNNGQMQTERLQIDGPSARVVMRGEVDLERETQRLNVNVQPELGGTAALGVALVNPVAGVATWVAHKVLQNPLNHMFGFDYLITGTWDDPKVAKVSGSDPPVPVPRLPTIVNPSGESNESSAK